MTVSMNGERADTRGASTVADLMERYQIEAATVLVEHNGVALHKREWAERKLTEGDTIEIVRVVAGG